MRTTPAIESRRRMSLYGIGPRFVRALDPVRVWLEEWDVQPTTVTLLAIPVEFAAVACLMLGHTFPRFLVAVPVLAVARLGLGMLDGSLARSTGRSSTRGAVLGELVDRLGDVMVVVVAFLIAPVWVSSVLAVGIFGTEVVAMIGWATTGQRRFPGPMGKPERAALLSVGAVAAIVWWPALTIAFAVMGVGSLFGAFIRTKSVIAAASVADVVGVA